MEGSWEYGNFIEFPTYYKNFLASIFFSFVSNLKNLQLFLYVHIFHKIP